MLGFGSALIYALAMSDGSVAATSVADQTRRVFVVHGRNEPARVAMFEFLRAVGLEPIEWAQALRMTGHASPYIGEVLDTAFRQAQAIVVLMTPDEVAYLRPEYANGPSDTETQPAAQVRPNVLFEAGMAIGRDARRTVLVELGTIRPFSDVAGRHAVRITNDADRRNDLVQRLIVAGCPADQTASDWIRAGDFSVPPPPGGGLPLGRRVPSSVGPRGVSLDARYHDRSNGGRLEIINRGSEPIFDVNVEIPEMNGFWVHTKDLPVPRLPPGKSFNLVVSLAMGDRKSAFDITITGRTENGDQVREVAFVDTIG